MGKKNDTPAPEQTASPRARSSIRFIGVRGAVRVADRALAPGELVADGSVHVETFAEWSKRGDFIDGAVDWPAPAGHEHVVSFKDGSKVVDFKKTAEQLAKEAAAKEAEALASAPKE